MESRCAVERLHDTFRRRGALSVAHVFLRVHRPLANMMFTTVTQRSVDLAMFWALEFELRQ